MIESTWTLVYRASLEDSASPHFSLKIYRFYSRLSIECLSGTSAQLVLSSLILAYSVQARDYFIETSSSTVAHLIYTVFFLFSHSSGLVLIAGSDGSDRIFVYHWVPSLKSYRDSNLLRFVFSIIMAHLAVPYPKRTAAMMCMFVKKKKGNEQTSWPSPVWILQEYQDNTVMVPIMPRPGSRRRLLGRSTIRAILVEIIRLFPFSVLRFMYEQN